MCVCRAYARMYKHTFGNNMTTEKQTDRHKKALQHHELYNPKNAIGGVNTRFNRIIHAVKSE